MRCDLRGKVAFVTGAAGAIGSAIARRLADNGAVVVVADINRDGAEAVAATLPGAIAVSLDIRDAASADAAVETTSESASRRRAMIMQVPLRNCTALEAES